MKKLIAALLCLGLLFSFAACSQAPETPTVSPKLAYSELKTALQEKGILAQNAHVSTLDDGRKMLVSEISYASGPVSQVSDIVVSFAAWDEAGKPMIIKTEQNPSNTLERFEVTMQDVIIRRGETWALDQGVYLAEECYNIAYVEAIVVSCTMDSSKWSNSLYDKWQQTFLGATLTDWMIAEMDAPAPVTHPADTTAPTIDLAQAYSELVSDLPKQNAVALNPAVHKELEEGKIILSADIRNNASTAMAQIKLAFAAWDASGDPILLKSASGLTEDAYIKEVDLGDVSVAAGQTWLAETESDVLGFRVADTQTDITYVSAIVVSYTAEDGTLWKNPVYTTWSQVFGGVPLEDWMMPEK